MAIERIRRSPTGKFIGTVANPLRNGPGTIGLVFRKHGIPTSGNGTVPLSSVANVPLNGFGYDEDTDPTSRFNVTMEPGYLYDLQFDYEMQMVGVATIAAWTTWYRTRNATTGVYGAWTQFPGQAHNPHQINGNTAASSQTRSGSDAVFALAVTTPVDRIQLGFAGATGLSVVPELAFARCSEYLAQ